MRGWLLDTNVIATLIAPRGASRVKLWAASQSESDLFLSILTVAEYDKGIHALPEGDARRVRYAAYRDALAKRFAGRLLMLEAEVVLTWGAISGRVRRDLGHPPPVIDTLLAATAIKHRLYLATRNVRDVRHSGAAVFDPWSDDLRPFL